MKLSAKRTIGIAMVLCLLPIVTIVALAKDADVSKGKEVYEGTCIACHGENGKGEIPGTPNFTKKDGVLMKTDEELIAHITDGYESPSSDMPMPAKGGNEDLTDDDIEAVLSYMRLEFGTPKK
ncbi:MAG: cytochrome c, class I [Alphaproteobacteria bacterium]|nr:MAG: cytochrome c, class I [Alphaproteobacteria bacterium]